MVTRGKLDRHVTVLFLNVGQGDATLLIDHTNDAAVLVDCKARAESLVEAALDQHAVSLDTAIITHFDADHSAGLIALLERRTCRQVVYNIDTGKRTAAVLAQHRQLLRLKNRGVTLSSASHGSTSHTGSIRWEVVWPTHAGSTAAFVKSDRNRASLILRVTVEPRARGANRKLLLSGDSGADAWDALLDDGVDLGCDVMQWPHHGAALATARGSRASRVVDAVKPSVTIVSAGTRNTYGHPVSDTLSTLAGRTRLMCTQVTGRCHSPTPATDTACAGTVEVAIGASGNMTVVPSVAAHLAVIQGWTHPQCLLNAQPGLSSVPPHRI